MTNQMRTYKNFSEWWAEVDPIRRDDAAVVLSDSCNVSLTTVAAWGAGKRNPRSRSKGKINRYLEAWGAKIEE